MTFDHTSEPTNTGFQCLMDYSQLPNDPDHPPGTSPWQTSPRQSRGESFVNSVSGSEPPSPVAANSSYRSGAPTSSQEQGSDQDTLVAGSREYPGAEDSEPSEAPTENGSSPDLSTRLQSPPLTEGEFSSQQQQYLHQQQQQQQQRQQLYQQQQRPSRYQSGGRATQRQNVPQQKLQAKITGLERTGRKDPILRFDVHVSMSYLSKLCRAYCCRLTFHAFEPLNFAMFGARTRNL